jgi:CRISPR-associated protein Cas5t
MMLNKPETSIVLRTVWRVKRTPLGSPGNTRPDYQQLLSPVHLAIWLDSFNEQGEEPTLEDRALIALDQPSRISRFGGLSLGESSHLVDEVRRLRTSDDAPAKAYLLADRGRLSLPVWVDHVGSAGTRFAVGELVERRALLPPDRDCMPRISPQ